MLKGAFNVPNGSSVLKVTFKVPNGSSVLKEDL